jgi:hypothetical protein
MTLVEVLVGAVVSMAVLGLAMLLLIPTLRASARGSTHAEMENQALLLSSLLCRDMDGSVPQGVSLSSDGHTVAFMPIQDLLDAGTLVWLPQFNVYTWDGQSVLRRVWYAPGPPSMGTVDGSTALRLTDVQMSALSSTTTLETRILASGVTAFALAQGGPAPSVTDAITLSVSLQRQAASGRAVPEAFTLTRSFSFRNRN